MRATKASLSIADAVRKMTSLPATRMGLGDRGVLRQGAMADVVVLDLKVVRDTARFGDPHHYATGARHVIVNGVAVSSRR